MNGANRNRLAIGVLMLVLARGAALADTVTFRNNGQTLTVEGNVLATDSQGSLLLEGQDTRHYIVLGSDLVEHKKSEKPVPLFTKQQLRISLQKELGPRFSFLSSTNYIICHSCSTEYAQDAKRLFEKSYSVFMNYFRNKGGFRFERPRQPLIAVICGSREEYIQMLEDELGAIAAQTSGVYIPGLNRMYMYDAFGGEMGKKLEVAARTNPGRAEDVAFLLKEQNISVIIHEGVHQIAYNSGFHNRNVRNPLWLVEGMAMYFESPDVDSKGGWGGLGKPNRERFEHFSKIFSTRSKDSLTKLVIDDTVLRDPETANDAYAEAWAVTFYLAQAKTKSYVQYIRIINEREPMVDYTPEERLRDFRRAFGKGPEELDRDFRKYMSAVKAPQPR